MLLLAPATDHWECSTLIVPSDRLFTDECPRTVIKSFIDDPTAPDTACVAKLGPPTFAPG